MWRTYVACPMVLLASVLTQACGGTPPEPPKGSEVPGTETIALATTLEREGASVTFAEVMSMSAHPYFRMPAARYVVNGENLYAFEYETESAAATEASRIAPDGASVGTTQISWVSDPHFYRARRVVVLYVGRQSSTLGLLQRVLGQQIAGR